MNKPIFASLLLGAGALVLLAQHPGSGPQAGGQEGGPPRQPPPLISALDANHDGVIDAAEIANAPAALRTLDKNGDGKLTRDEIHPQGGGPRGGEGGGPPPR
jgi:hypothetical protein